MKTKEIQDSNIEEVLAPSTDEDLGDIPLRKLTPASLALCEMLKLSVVTGASDDDTYSNFEILCFLWLHSRPAKEARGPVFDMSQGKEPSTGRTYAVINAVLDWADQIAFTQFTEAAKRIQKLLSESFTGMVEAVEDNDAKKKAPRKRQSKAKSPTRS